MKKSHLFLLVIILLGVIFLGMQSVVSDVPAISPSKGASIPVQENSLLSKETLNTVLPGTDKDRFEYVSSRVVSTPGIVNTHSVCSSCSQSVSSLKNESVPTNTEVGDRISAMNADIKRNNWDWVAGRTSVMYRSDESRKHMKGLKHENSLSADMTSLPEPTNAEIRALPASFDWRNHGGNYLTPIRDQGNCGSCWAFATTAAFESYWERRMHNPNLNPNFAEQALVSCAYDNDGCDGGYFSSMKYFVNTRLNGAVGTVTESKYPYVARTTSCKNLAGFTRYKVHTGGRWGYVSGSEWTIPSVNAIKNAVYKYGPVAVGIYADDYFDSYSGGIFGSRLTSNAYDTNHGVLIYGWGVYKNKIFWKVKNSWGTNWGESGYFRIYTNYNRIGEGAAYFTAPS